MTTSSPRDISQLGITNRVSEVRTGGKDSLRLVVLVRTADCPKNGPAGVVARVIKGNGMRSSFRVIAEPRYVASADEIVELAAANGIDVDAAFAVRMFEGR